MTKPQLTPTQGILVAIDIGKTRNEVLIEIPGPARRRRLTVLNTRAEYDRLISLLSGLGQPVTCAFEATGNYHRALAWRLLQAGFTVRLISSLALARTREALHNGWDKNDPKDAQVTLHMLRIGATQHYHDPLAAGLNDIQEVSKTHEAISKAKTEVLHRILTHHLPLYFPEIDRFRHNSRSDWFFAFLDRFPTPGRIAEARSLIQQRNALEAMAVELLHESPDYKLLCRIPGVGPITALTILAEAGDLRRFGHHRQFLKFCGLDLATHQSGAFRGQTKLSKYGNARLRRALWLAGQVAIRQKENSFRDKFERYIARDRHNADLRRKALTAITAKMARVVHAIIKSGADYRPFVEEPVPGGRTSLSMGREGATATL
jgi:transposase